MKRQAKPKRQLTEEQKQKLRDNMAKVRAAKAQKVASSPAPEEQAERPQTLAELGLRPEPEPYVEDYVLSDDEMRRIEEEADAAVKAERKAKLLKAHKQQALDRARRRAGDIPADEERQRELAETATIRISLPQLRLSNGRECPADPIIIDQHVFHNGVTYRVTRAQYEYLSWQQAQRWSHQAQVDGRTRTYYNGQLEAQVAFNGFAPASGGAFGPSFDAIHRRTV